MPKHGGDPHGWNSDRSDKVEELPIPIGKRLILQITRTRIADIGLRNFEGIDAVFVVHIFRADNAGQTDIFIALDDFVLLLDLHRPIAVLINTRHQNGDKARQIIILCRIA